MVSLARTSKKDQILASAIEIIGEDGIHAVTYDRLAETTGLSKSGLIYHFPSRHALLRDIHTYGAARWESELEDYSGGRKADELTPPQRLRALLSSLAKNDPLAELLMNIHAQTDPEYSAPWESVSLRWGPDPAAAIASDADLTELIALIMGEGLWIHDHITETKLSADNRAKLIEFMLSQLPEEN